MVELGKGSGQPRGRLCRLDIDEQRLHSGFARAHSDAGGYGGYDWQAVLSSPDENPRRRLGKGQGVGVPKVRRAAAEPQRCRGQRGRIVAPNVDRRGVCADKHIASWLRIVFGQQRRGGRGGPDDHSRPVRTCRQGEVDGHGLESEAGGNVGGCRKLVFVTRVEQLDVETSRIGESVTVGVLQCPPKRP